MISSVSHVLLLCIVSLAAANKNLIEITDENWRDLLKGEWMVEFYAPWCPACKDLSKTWASFADWSKDLDIKVAHVDVTAHPGLSGRFLVTALPTIYHVKDSVFRQYAGPRDKDDFISFIEDKKWSIVDPLPSWKNPDSAQMAVVAKFFQMSMTVRDAHTYLIEKKGIPAWGSYMIFGVATLVLGCILGFFIVCIIDFLFPAAAEPVKQPDTKGKGKKPQQKGKDQKKDKKEHASDEEVQEPNTHHSQSEGSGDEKINGDEKLRQRKKETKVANGKPAQNEKSPQKKKQ